MMTEGKVNDCAVLQIVTKLEQQLERCGKVPA